MLLTILQGPAWPPGQTVIQPQMSAVPWRSAAPGHHGRQAASLKESLTRGSPRPGQAEGPALPHCLRLGLFTFSLGLLTAPGVPRHAQLVRAQSKTFLLVGRGKEGKPMLFGGAPPRLLQGRLSCSSVPSGISCHPGLVLLAIITTSAKTESMTGADIIAGREGGPVAKWGELGSPELPIIKCPI